MGAGKQSAPQQNCRGSKSYILFPQFFLYVFKYFGRHHIPVPSLMFDFLKSSWRSLLLEARFLAWSESAPRPSSCNKEGLLLSEREGNVGRGREGREESGRGGRRGKGRGKEGEFCSFNRKIVPVHKLNGMTTCPRNQQQNAFNLLLSTLTTPCFKKHLLSFLVITSLNIDRFSNLFSPTDSKGYYLSAWDRDCSLTLIMLP